jgi:hypothetical protein
VTAEAIIVQQWARTVTVVGDVTMKTRVRNLPWLNKATDSLMVNNACEVGKLVLSRTSCL